MKRREIISLIAMFILTSLIVLLVISLHSNELIKKWMQMIVCILIVICGAVISYDLIMIKAERKKFFKGKLKIIFMSCLGVYILGCFFFLFILYGPINNFRNWLVTTAMGTMNHQYLCKWFYSEEEILKVFEEDYIKEGNESTDSSLIDFSPIEKFANKYEEELFKGHTEDELYRIIRFKVNDQNAYLAVVYDPSRISVVNSARYPEWGQYVTKMAETAGAPLAINGGGFKDPGHNSTGAIPEGVCITSSKIVIGENKVVSHIIGFNKENKLVLLRNKTGKEALEMGIRDAVTRSPFLIVNGKPSFIKGSGGWGYAARTAIGQRKDGAVLLLVVDSNATRTKGASMLDLTEIMTNYGAFNAANLDGGTSSVMVENYELVNQPVDIALNPKTRPVATAIIVK